MPRRPRPETRRPPKSLVASTSLSKPNTATEAPRKETETGSVAKHCKPQTQQEDSESEAYISQTGSDGLSEVDSDSDLSGSDQDDSLGVDAEPDVPRVAQWVDEDDLDRMSDGSSVDEEGDEDRLRTDLQLLSYGALRKAQKALAQARAVESDSGEEALLDDSEPHQGLMYPTPRLNKDNEKDDAAPRKQEIPKRKHKHAPMEMSSKRPVSRSRFIAEKITPRDPRFLSVTGEWDAKRFQTQYGFLSGMHEDELKSLRDNLKRARKLCANSPQDLREEREVEVERLERAVKRAESAVNKDRQKNVEIEALSRAAKEERERQKQGKKAWHMKDADKKALLLRAKYDALAETGGKGAVRKAIEKKQKKVSQKEKKKIPSTRLSQRSTSGPTRQGGPAGKRPRFENEDGSRKRRRSSS